MDSQAKLQEILMAIPGSKHAYFQPPTTVRMEYPCIRYKYASDAPQYGDNDRYKDMMRYTVTVIDKDPTSAVAKAVRRLPYCRLETVYAADNLNHFTFTLYF